MEQAETMLLDNLGKADDKKKCVLLVILCLCYIKLVFITGETFYVTYLVLGPTIVYCMNSKESWGKYKFIS